MAATAGDFPKRRSSPQPRMNCNTDVIMMSCAVGGGGDIACVIRGIGLFVEITRPTFVFVLV